MAVTLSLLAGAGWQFFDNNGNPLTGGLLYTYDAGSTTPRTTYTSSSGATANTNPIVLDSAGRVDEQVWLDTSYTYKFVLQTSTGVQIWSKDNIPSSATAADVLFTPAGIGAVARTVQSKLLETVSPEDYGAAGTGLAVDTAALQAAINTGKSVRGTPGATYLIGPLTQSTADQVLDFTGCNLKRINSSPHAAMVTLNGARATVKGGRWDGNKANQSGTVNDQYAQAAVTVIGDYCVVEGIESVNSWGIGIKGVNCSYASIRFNKTIDPELFGIFVECTSADKYGNEILDNYAASVGLPNVSGIYLTGTNDFLINQYFWKVCRNTVQCSQDPAVTGICITTRAYDGVCNDNNTTGGTMGISGDSATRTTFSGNRCSDTSGAADYGIEINNSLCTVAGNAIDNCKWGISISGAVFNQNYTTISGNVINPKNGGIGIYALGQINGVKTITAASSTNPIQFTSASHGLSNGNFVTFTELPGNFSALNGNNYPVTVTGANTFTVAVDGAAFAAYTSGGKALRGVAQYSSITGNTVKFNAQGAAFNGGTGIYLAGRTEYATITGNSLIGPGQVVPDGNGVFLDNTGGYCSVIGNRFSGFTTPLGLYSGGPSTFTDVSFNANDCTYDCPPSESLVGVSGGATVGARVTQMWNNSTAGVNGNFLDTSIKRSLIWTDGVPTPEARVSGALGSIFVNPGYDSGNTLYIKEAAAESLITAATSANPIEFTTSGSHDLIGGVKTISAATSANPIEFTTSSAHFFRTGIFVQLGGLPGSFAALNAGYYQITVTGANTFTVAVNGSGFAAYTSGGTATPPQYNVLFKNLPGSFAFLNGKSFPVTVTSATTFTVPVNGSAYTAYTSGGTAENLNDGWISVGYAYATAAQIADKTNAINTLRKRVGRSVWDTTNNRLMIAAGGADTSRWYVCDGSAFVTPA